MIHPATALRPVDPIVGMGVFATAAIPAGTVTWVLDPLDQTIEPQRLRREWSRWSRWRDHHTFADRHGLRVLAWDLCRSMNHSCRPNCAGTDLGFEIAIRDIRSGEELTNDYGTLHIAPREGFPCRCGAPGCRGVVLPDESATVRWTPAVRAALELAAGVPQPLAELLPLGWRERAEEDLRDEGPAPSRVARGASPPAAAEAEPRAEELAPQSSLSSSTIARPIPSPTSM